MITRRAFFEGKIKQGCEELFYQEVKENLLPVWQSMPNVLDVRIHRIEAVDDGAPQIFFMQEIDYPSHEAMQEAMQSPKRELAKAAHEKIMRLYDGRHFHIIAHCYN
ncbi:hypothetical protein [Polycladidibacter stylochi]|uniref:hypothetical protein n=1 Tax=Polycladidibacter stylochi TaxID=1807766 RepID=UPI0008307445|nr:hypothetical protein [Pseudovibrio stylochi]